MFLKKIVRGIYSKRSPYRMKVATNYMYCGTYLLSDKALGEILKRKGISFETRKCESGSGLEFYYLGHLGERDHRIYSWYQYYPDLDDYHYSELDRINRTDPDVIAVIEELKGEANCGCSKIFIVEIPDDVDWYIEYNDGFEYVAEKHRTWGRD